jgi:hypothetical protein
MTPIDILPLLTKFYPRNDVESRVAYFKTHVPWVAPEAYLNIIYKPVPRKVAEAAAERLNMPRPLRDFFHVYNGVSLFSSALSVYGIHAPGQLLERQNVFMVLPFDIETEAASYPPEDAERYFVFGGYGWDGSTVCMDRCDRSVHLFRRESGALASQSDMRWKDLEEWLTTEIARLSLLFDSVGKRLVAEVETVPSQSPWVS